MDSKYSRESSDEDEVKKKTDRHRHSSRKRDLGQRGCREDDSDSNDAREEYGSRWHELKDVYSDEDQTKVRISEKNDGRIHERWQSEDGRKNASRRSPGEGYERIDRDRNRHDRYERRQGDNKRREQERGDQKEPLQNIDKDEQRMNRDKNRHNRNRMHHNENHQREQERVDRKESYRSSDENEQRDDKDKDKKKHDRDRRHQGKNLREDRGDRNETYQSFGENEERMDRDKSRHDRDRRHLGENRHNREQDRGDWKKSYTSSDEDEQQERKHDHRRCESENGNKNMDRHLHHDSKDERVKALHRKSEHGRNWNDNDREKKHSKHDYKYRNSQDLRDKEVNEQREDRRNIGEKEKAGTRTLDHPQPHRQEKQSENNLNSDASNLGKSGGVYIPPFKLARMMREVQDKSSVEYQRLTWDALRKSINGLVNKVNATNIKNIIPELFAENLIRGRGLFCRSCMKSQMASPGFTDVFAALVSVVNTKFPEVGDLLLRRIVLQLKRAYKRNDKPQLLAAVKFIAHLVNQQVAHEIIALELLTVLLENPTDDSVEVAVGFVTECGSILQDFSPKGLHGIFERFRGILHEGEIDKRVQFLIEGLFAIRKAKFEGYPAVRPELDLVEQEDQLTHEMSLQEEIDPEIALDIFKSDPNFLENEKRYEDLKKNILGEESEDEEDRSDAGSDDEEDEDEENDNEEEDEEQMQINDETETNLVNLRRTIYLTIMSSVDFEEAGHKLLKIKLEPGQEIELCVMLLECCSQERTYLRYYGLLGQRFCKINKVHQENFEKCFVQQYSMIHRLETNKLRNVAKFFAHLLGTDALPWHVLSYIRLTEEDTTSSSRIFIKILFQELSEHLGIRLLNERLNDPTMQDSFESIFPRDNPKNTRFSINFFTSIGLGGLTENLREYLKNMPRLIMQQQKPVSDSDEESGSSDSSGSDSSTSQSESDSSSSEESEGEDRRRGKKRRKTGR
ncbi:pre-mRNA-splicing factor CWC22 homolog [Cucurbita maxima]|uniref:Pre-mRNA-splicing factor CWC22 homolog n=1 Tax=Cucurbita maxima TaxID=3661 RepID=A0A6J1I0I9_CUCMA|nr:pre-mRNA-splicing factor CWC22 homolog [Cucurbita maxima]XP_022969291.1 pre-mRNA-splicing factor CWC22 homolog [Cucurbita maxima]XP_022969299.1 pre-mRNA-splicing factor CWC22 homolog [Cucurbita maxima]XP_022969308.1 pre-mRNA-splicing factor CWC22 homolog [Cucurbita maxima]XP_022969316.1 pre-mRNA-splicing factor CWC22 homolog [Cucurbita maxima]XP_022969320.1 pre-mRNA-splicing factor CWC22 homolog [Cucurbita maxima]XP_022969324.1 pre-mRNA-splicing factor CWC22 homolog [Cucurbita maxima]